MKVLVTTPFSPLPADFGGALRLFDVLKALAAKHEVSLLTFGRPEDAGLLRREFELASVSVIPRVVGKPRYRWEQLASLASLHSHHQRALATPAFQAALDALFAAERFEVLHTEFSHLGPVRVPAGVAKVLDAHNVEYDVFRRQYETSTSAVRKAYYLLEWKKLQRDELAWCGQQDALITTSERDREVFAAELPRVRTWVVPNGVDSAYFRPGPKATEPRGLVFTGAMQYVPNVDGVRWFCAEVLPLIRARVRDVKLTIVGKEPPPEVEALAGPSVVVTGRVPDVRPYVHRAAVYVVPLRMGGGTRLKVVEALAMKKPMVSTRIGAEGIAVVDGESALLADRPEDFANAVVRLLGDARLQVLLAENGHRLMKKQYEWSFVNRTLEDIYASLSREKAA
jgi:glycosyltransferase involved in cell wall biosynthesis